jgi:hypothetical protein
MTDGASAKAQFRTAALLMDQAAQHRLDARFVKMLEDRFDGDAETWEQDFDTLPGHLQEFFERLGGKIIGLGGHRASIAFAAAYAEGIRMGREGQP